MSTQPNTSGQAQPLVRGTSPEIVVHGHHMSISERLRGHVVQRLDRVERFGIDIMRIDVEVTHHANPRMSGRAYTVELTCRVVGPVVRAEAHASDPHAAVDLAADHLEQRLQRAAKRRTDRSHGREGHRQVVVVPRVVTVEGTSSQTPSDDSDVVFEQGPIIVREKRHAGAPMDLEEALEAMESVGHDFYLFLDAATGVPSVIYRRRGWQYGLIRLEPTATT